MRQAVLALTAVVVIIFLMQPLAQVAVVKANMIITRSIEIQSPLSYKTIVYETSTIDVTVKVDIIGSTSGPTSIFCSLDGKPNATLSVSSKDNIYFLGTGTLTNLTDGFHTLTAYYYNPYFTQMSTSTVFLVNASKTLTDSTPPPIPTSFPTSSPAPKHSLPIMISPQNQTTYNTDQVPLVYTINSSVFYSYYSLDSPSPNTGWKSFDGNITLPSLSEGQHNLVLNVATEEPHQVYSTIQTVTFYIHTVDATPTPNPTQISQPSPPIPEFPATLAITLLLITVLAVVVVFRRKTQ